MNVLMAYAKRDWLNPVAGTVFAGADPPGRSRRPQRDLRSWDTIRTWAAQALATASGPAQERKRAGQ